MSETCRLLICDDDKLDRMVVMRELRNCDFEFTECNSAKSAFELLKDNHFDCVLLDLQMPNIDGLTTLKTIIHQKLTRAPIIILSGSKDERLAAQCMQYGAQDCILKSCLHKDSLLRSIHNARERNVLEYQLQSALAEAETANRVKSEFLANISHELRTPLHAIIGFTNRVLKATKNTPDEKNYLALEIVQENAHHLSRLITSILDYTEIEAGKTQLSLEKIDICVSLKDLITMMEPMAKKNNTELILLLPDEDILVEVDPTKISQVALNLVSNAIKFTQNGTVILELTLTATDEHKSAFCIKVSDTGNGIKPEDQGVLFQHFTHVEPSLTKFSQGIGLGLSIVKEYVEMHRGEVSFSSTYGKGSVFTVIIPTKAP